MAMYLRDGIIRRVKAGVDPKEYERNHPTAIEVTDPLPDQETLAEWMSDGGCEAVNCGCWTEPDGVCEHGNPSWLMALGYV